MSESRRDPLHEQVLETCRRYALLEGAESVLVGVSGGQDSVALLHVLVSLEAVPKVAAVHVHHGLRGGEADADAAVVEALCEQLGVRCFVVRRDVEAEAEQAGVGIELAGRRARYEEYERVADENGFDRIATGHTGTDRAETLLLNLFRGAGLRGMRSIPPQRGRIVRPLIRASRDQTGRYCRRHSLPIRTDRSNLDPDYARRNAVRHHLMPLIEERFPGADEALMRACEAVEEELAWTESLLEGWLEDAIVERDDDTLALDAAAVSRLHPGAAHRLLRLALESVRGNLSEVSREQTERVGALTEAGTGSAVVLPGGWEVRREYGCLVVAPSGEEAERPCGGVELPVPGTARLAACGVQVRAERRVAPDDYAADDPWTAWIAGSAAAPGLVVRSTQPGDRFVPLGMNGSRKLQDFFVDEKVPRRLRAHVPVVANPDGRILWVVGHRLAEPARVRRRDDAVRLTAAFEQGSRAGAKEDA
ncbi:MAG: tRNA lysidine(34) synthetase TilS [Armatimonadota bacterium]